MTTTLKLSDTQMNTTRKILMGLAGAVLACIVLAAPSAKAQTISTATPTASGTVGGTTVTATSTSTGTGTAGLKGTKLSASSATSSTGTASVTSPTIASVPEPVSLGGPISMTASYIPDPAGGTATMAYFIDATKVSGTGRNTGLTYVAASGQANSTRQFALQDQLQITMPFFPNTPDGFLSPRTMLVTLNVSIDPTTHAVSAVTSSIGDFVAAQ